MNRQIANLEVPSWAAGIENWQHRYLGRQLETVDCLCALNLNDFITIFSHHFYNFANIRSNRTNEAIYLWTHEYPTDNPLNDSFADQT